MVTARVAKGVSKTQIRLRVKVVTSLVIFVREFCVVAGFVKSVRLVLEFVAKPRLWALYLVLFADGKHNL